MPKVYVIDTDKESEFWDLSVLDHAESARAATIIQPKKREQWIRSRIALREILGNEMQIPADEVSISQVDSKPQVVGQGIVPQFSLSRSDRYAFVAIENESCVGVDIEIKRAVRNRNAKAARFFCLCEQNELQDLRETDRDDAFLKIWTAKEAWLKATGIGLVSLPVTSVCVSLDAPIHYSHVSISASDVFGDDTNDQPQSDWDLWWVDDPDFVACVTTPKNIREHERLVKRFEPAT